MLFVNTSPTFNPCGESVDIMLPVANPVLWSIVTYSAPPTIWNSLPSPPQALPSMSSIRLFLISIRRDGWLTPASLSGPAMLNPPPERLSALSANFTSCTTDHGDRPLWLRGVNRIAKPFWLAAQLYSKTFDSISARCAFFNSRRFFTDHLIPAYEGWPSFHFRGFATLLRRNSTSDGTRPWMGESAPPSMKFSPAPSR